ncbi:MAG: SMP-30/gluconolactonase/LRE family protein [Ahrensia sp.]|nr:SMP-30/gluconolactonase/LRE family protein [Ahrensia sp.]
MQLNAPTTQLTSFGPACTLGEGPLWHPLRQQLFWFDIVAGTLYGANQHGGQKSSWKFGEAASAAGWVDVDTLIVATASGLQRFSISSGSWETLAPMEADNKLTRSNDGRIGPDGSFWIGTMGYNLEPRAGAYYRYRTGMVQQLFDQVTVPNATCFAPDGKTAFLSDTARQVIWRWPLDDQGNPMGEREVHIDLRDEGLNPDGAVCDAEGYLWNAQWGAARVARYAPDGSLDRVIDLPVSQPTCPCFGGDDLKTLYITSAREGLSEEVLAKQPQAGEVFSLRVEVPGIEEFRAEL